MSALDSRAWLVWGICCMVPLLLARHPAIVIELLLIVLVVRLVSTPPAQVRWGWIVRISVLFAAVGVVFNALTVRSGNQIAFHLPLLDWDITWNAIAYGVVSGFAMVTLVLTGVTTAAGLDWIALTRVLPRRLAPLAVSGSVAWSFLPAASQSFAEIREAQAARGHEMRSVRDVLPIVVPLLDGALDRALTTSETLEARGFGGSQTVAPHTRNWTPLAAAALLVGALLTAYAISLNTLLWLLPALALVVLGLVGMLLAPASGSITTRYREHHFTRADWVVTLVSPVTLAGFLLLVTVGNVDVVFNPYPNLELPATDVRALLVLMPLLAPALYPYRAVQS